MKKICLTVISRLNPNEDIIRLLKKNYEKYILNISRENNIITMELLNNAKMEVKIADDALMQLKGMYNYYSGIDGKTQVAKESVLNQISLSNNVIYFHFDLDNPNDIITKLIMSIILKFASDVKGYLIYSDLSIQNWNDELLMSPKDNIQTNNVESTYKENNVFEETRFSDDDKIRINKNISILKQQGIPYDVNFDLVPTKNNTNLKSGDKIFNSLICNYVVATMAATFGYGSVDKEFYNDVYKSLNRMYGFEKYMTKDDKKILDQIKRGKLTISPSDLSWAYEECAIEMWMLGLWEFPSQQQECDIDQMNEIIYADPNNSGIPRLFIKIADDLKDKTKNLKIKSYEEILEKADLLNRYKWAYENQKINFSQTNYHVNTTVLYYQLRAFYDILNWNPDESCFSSKRSVR